MDNPPYPPCTSLHLVIHPSDLLLAVKEGNLKITRFLIEKGADVNWESNDTTPLIESVKVGNLEITRFLIDKGADVNRKSNDTTPLMESASRNDFEMTRFLIDKGADLNSNTKGWTPLMISVCKMNNKINNHESNGTTSLIESMTKNNPEHIMRLLVDKGADVNCESGGWTPLMMSLSKRDFEMTRFLIDKGADVNRDRYGITPLIESMRPCYPEQITRLLVDKGANVNCESNGWTPLMLSLFRMEFEMARLLVDKGADVNCENSGWTPLMMSLSNREFEMARLLVDKGADVNCESSGWTPLMMSLSNRDIEMTRFLIDEGADVNRKAKGITPLMVSVKVGKLEMTRFLIDKGADVNQQDNMQMTAFHYIYDNSDCHRLWTEVFLKSGADLNVENHLGLTPFGYRIHKRIQYIYDGREQNYILDNDHHVSLFIKYIALHLARGSLINPKNTNAIMTKPKLKEKFILCLNELDRARKTSILGRFTMFDVLTKSCTYLRLILMDENVHHFETGLENGKFYVYKDTLIRFFYEKTDVLKARNTCVSLMNRLFETKLPPEIVERICDFLAKNDFRKLIDLSEYDKSNV